MGRSDRGTAAGTSASTSSPDPPSCEGRLSSADWRNSDYLTISDDVAYQAAASALSFVQRKTVPSLQMRCMITPSRRASATVAFRPPRRLAIFIAHAFNHDHFT